MMVPIQATLISAYIILSRLGWILAFLFVQRYLSPTSLMCGVK